MFVLVRVADLFSISDSTSLKVMILSNVRLFLPFRVKSSQEKYLHSLFTPKY